MNFTDKIAHFIDENKIDLSHLTIVLPSERAIKYISASLYNFYKKPILAPKMITIDRWVRDSTENTIVDRTRLLVKLFNIQLENPIDPKDKSFDEFQTWGQTLLSDFDEIDRYLLDPKVVFRNLADIREIENWSFNSTDPTPAQKRFMEFWERLPVYYEKLNKELDREGLCYAGKAYRQLAENIDWVFKQDKERIFLFAGFNALSSSELSILKQLHRLGRAHIIVDADTFYLKDEVHEAGVFLRKLIEELGVKELPYVQDSLLNDPLELEIIECVQQTGQVKVASTLLNGFDKNQLDETLVLLADEALIVPLLRNIPANVGNANISLGLPIKNTSIRTWIDLLMNIQENKRRFNTDALYFQDVQKFWNHPFVISIMDDKEKQHTIELELAAVRHNHIFRNIKSLGISQKLDTLLQMVAEPWENNWVKAIELIRNGLAHIDNHLKEEDLFNRALISGFDAAVIDFENITREGLPDMTLKSFKHLMQQHWINKSIAYHGNPIDGLQIMGLLETRLLDFKNIIVIGLNEGKMPPTNPIQTMIPMDLRKWLGLPTPREKQGLFAHHFYRLLHRCEKMWVTYTSASEAIGSNEASRYLMQLELELARKNKEFQIKKSLYAVSEEEMKDQASPEIFKTDDMLEKLDEKFSRSLSASAMKKYIACPLDFYYRFILDFEEEDDFEEDIESHTLGTFIHAVLEEMYEPFARHNSDGTKKTPQPPALTSFDVEKMLDRYEKLLHQEFLKKFNNDPKAFQSGKNLLSYKMATELTQRILKKEIEFLRSQKDPVFIEHLELEILAPIQVEVQGVMKTIQLKGFIDRVDSVGERIRIIDYKSGKVKDNEASITLSKCEEDILGQFGGTKHALQLAMYAFIFREKFGYLPDEVGLFSLINVSSGLIKLKDKEGGELKNIADLFPKFLSELLDEVYNKEIPFTHKDAFVVYCEYCL